MNILVTGANGQLGRELIALAPERHSVFPVGHAELDIASEPAVSKIVADHAIDLIVNAAAYTQVDRAEEEPEAAMRVNRDGAAVLARAAAARGAAMIHVSTDFVFDGESETPYQETDPTHPLGMYGHSKREGELAVAEALDRHIILRTSWLYGYHGRNFVKTMIELAETREELRVVADQQGCPTSAEDLAGAIWTVADTLLTRPEKAEWGIFHYCGRGITTWHGLAELAIRMAREYKPLACQGVTPIPASSYPTPARRPAFSALDCAKIQRVYGVVPRLYLDSLRKVVHRLRTGDMPLFC